MLSLFCIVTCRSGRRVCIWSRGRRTRSTRREAWLSRQSAHMRCTSRVFPLWLNYAACWQLSCTCSFVDSALQIGRILELKQLLLLWSRSDLGGPRRGSQIFYAAPCTWGTGLVRGCSDSWEFGFGQTMVWLDMRRGCSFEDLSPTWTGFIARGFRKLRPLSLGSNNLTTLLEPLQPTCLCFTCLCYSRSSASGSSLLTCGIGAQTGSLTARLLAVSSCPCARVSAAGMCGQSIWWNGPDRLTTYFNFVVRVVGFRTQAS